MAAKFFLLIFVIQLCTAIEIAQAQYKFKPKVFLVSGSLAEIVPERNINVLFDYSDFPVGTFKTEEEYTTTKVTGYNSQEPGKGDQWLDKWITARKERYEPNFLSSINKKVKKSQIRYAEDSLAKYMLIVKITYLEIGFDVGVRRSPAFADFEFLFVENRDPSVIIAKLSLQRVIGSNVGKFDDDVYNTNEVNSRNEPANDMGCSRIAEVYGNAGNILGKFLLKAR